MLSKTKRIEILQRQIDKLPQVSSNYSIWLSQTENLLEKAFPNDNLKAKTIRDAIRQPGAAFMGIDVGQLTTDWRTLMEGFIYEIGLESENEPNSKIVAFVHQDRITSLENLVHPEFDFSRFVVMCKEINSNFSNKNYLSVVILGRSVLDHVPPIFNFNTFNEVANNYPGKSFRQNMEQLNKSMRSMADSYLHQTIRKKEMIPNEIQVNFSRELDVLLAEVIRICS